jgi:hypothetical protein
MIKRMMPYAPWVAGVLWLCLAGSVHAQTYVVSGECGGMPTYEAAPSTQATTVSGVNLHNAPTLPSQVRIPMEIPLSDYTDTSAVNANLSETRLRPADIYVDTNTGEIDLQGTPIAPRATINPDCAASPDSVYTTK